MAIADIHPKISDGKNMGVVTTALIILLALVVKYIRGNAWTNLGSYENPKLEFRHHYL